MRTDVGTVTIVVDNPSSWDRLLNLQAVLNNAIFLVESSHEGTVMDTGIQIRRLLYAGRFWRFQRGAGVSSK